MKYGFLLLMLSVFTFSESIAQKKKKNKKEKVEVLDTAAIRYIQLDTDSGKIVLHLFDSTVQHRMNFVKLVANHFFDSLLFHRVIPEFMVQGGDPKSKNARDSVQLGDGGDELGRIPAEFFQTYYHKAGALAAARDGNPEKASSACQFYIVDGKKFTDEELDRVEQRFNFKIPDSVRTVYKTIGGAPFLDQNYTVFGEVVEGLDVIKKIANVPRDERDRPYGNLRMKMSILKKYEPTPGEGGWQKTSVTK